MMNIHDISNESAHTRLRLQIIELYSIRHSISRAIYSPTSSLTSSPIPLGPVTPAAWSHIDLLSDLVGSSQVG